MFVAKAALRIMTRRRFKSLVVLAVSLVLVLFINMYAETISKHQDTLTELYENIEVAGYITSADGTKLDDLNIGGSVIHSLEESGFIGRALYTRSLRCMMEPLQELDPVSIYVKLFNAPKLVAATEIAAISSFSRTLPVFMEGYDEELFASEETVCIVSDDFLVSNNLQLGDQLQLAVVEYSSQILQEYRHGTVSLQVVGTYPSTNYMAPLYCPWAIMEDIYQDLELPLIWDSASFIFQNTQELGEFKVLLGGMGFVSGDAGRRPGQDDKLGFIIDDGILTAATSSVSGYIQLSHILYPIIYLLCAGIGFVVSYLLVRLRKPEFAIMRSLGTSRGGGFLLFFIEQALLATTGTVLGIIVSLILSQGLTTTQMLSVAGYLVLYLVGTAIAITTLNRVNVIQILTARE